MKTSYNVKFTLGALLVMMTCGARAEYTDIECASPYGCQVFNPAGPMNEEQAPRIKYSINYLGTDIASRLLEAENIHVNVKAGKYQNLPAQSNGITEHGMDAYALFPLTQVRKDYITLEKGVDITLDNYPNSAASILYLWHGQKGIVEKGVSINIGHSFDQYHGSGDEGGQAFILHKESSLDNQADITLAGNSTQGFNLQDSTVSVLSHNHKVRLEGEGAVVATLFDGGHFVADNVDILGNDAKYQQIFNIFAGADHNTQVELRNSKVNLNEDSAVITFISDGSNSHASMAQLTATLDHNEIKTGVGVNVFAQQSDQRNDAIVDIQGGIFTANKLVNINDPQVVALLGEGASGDNTTLTLNASGNAQLSGVSYINPTQLHGNVKFNLRDGSHWRFKGDSSVDNLNVDNATVEFDQDSQFHTLTINHDLEGNGIFVLNSDLSAQQADMIAVKGLVKGSHLLKVRDSHKEPSAPNGKVILVTSHGGDGQFALKDKPFVDAGVYRYLLRRQGDHWELAHLGEKAAPENKSPTPQIPSTSVSAGGFGYTVANESAPVGKNAQSVVEKTLSQWANNTIALMQASQAYLFHQSESLHQRVNTIHQNEKSQGLWLLNSNSWDKFDSFTTAQAKTSGFEQNNHTLTLGYDKSWLNGSTRHYFGILAGTGRANIDVKQGYGDGRIRAYHAGVYGGVEWQNGVYLDGDYHYTRVHLKADGVDEQHKNAHSVRLGTGAIVPMTAQFSLVPQGDLSAVKFNGDTLYQSRIGAQVRAYWATNRIEFKPFVGAYWLKDYGHHDIVLNGYALDVQHLGSRAQLEAGMLAQTYFGAFTVSAQREQGKHFKRKTQLQIGYSYQW
ncbi:autotransporter outer membrane beta-barrel domain-containing protein [Pasteurellaceae bacterium HPA106]|uniref:autotransporter outer membrane beta-barrel domain-containing protein n=1 Tax=Spirabiliibacterium pneumoniae TaxID=221400 RepID=UPI001AACE394|nr:autotransporter outer membrane beta-barrel domain-containing protein [Spirabiliibacterium pneumoniae]MBE2896989.1 autotransporter outer membrane beta-barrel domain-containing protein [Spirabiliibacterium pneumoniae]